MFQAISADAEGVTQVESLCMKCMKNGITKLLPTKIPHFKQIVVTSFHCDECGFENRDIMPASDICERGVKYDLKVSTKEDLDREVIRSQFARLSVPVVDFSLEPGQSKVSSSIFFA